MSGYEKLFRDGPGQIETQGARRARERSELIAKHLDWRVDPEAEMAYVTLTDKPIVKTKDIWGGIVVDLDADNQVVGIEVFL